MTSLNVKVRRWGNSLGIILPSHAVLAKNIKENDEISIIIVKDSKKALQETWGIGKGKLKKTAQKFKDEARRELY